MADFAVCQNQKSVSVADLKVLCEPSTLHCSLSLLSLPSHPFPYPPLPPFHYFLPTPFTCCSLPLLSFPPLSSLLFITSSPPLHLPFTLPSHLFSHPPIPPSHDFFLTPSPSLHPSFHLFPYPPFLPFHYFLPTPSPHLSFPHHTWPSFHFFKIYSSFGRLKKH